MDSTEVPKNNRDAGVKLLSRKSKNPKKQTSVTKIKIFKFPEVRYPKRQEINLMDYHDSWEATDVQKYAKFESPQNSGPDQHARPKANQGRAHEPRTRRRQGEVKGLENQISF